MFGLNRMRQFKAMAQNPKDSDLARALAQVVAGVEHDLLDAVADLHDAQGLDDPVTVEGTAEERVDALLDLADAASDGDFQRYWFEEAADYDDYEAVEEFVGIGVDAWQAQIAEWAEMYREKAPAVADGRSDRDLAEYHVEGEFGVPLAEFEREVVEFSKRRALKQALAGNLLAGVEGVKRSADHARGATEGTA